MTIPAAVVDNSLLGATGELENLTRVLRWRPGLHVISMAEEANFYMGLHLKGKEFGSLDAARQFIQRLIPRGEPVPRVPPETPLERAQALVYETIGAPRKTRVEKCRQALDIYPGCADAWVIMSEYEKDAKAKLKMLQQAVKAGQECLHDAGIEVDQSGRPLPSRRRDEPEGMSLWHHPARPYMRARLALAVHLYEMADKRTAIDEYRDLLELNPQDDQGVRYLLATALLEKGGEAAVLEAAALVEKLRDVSPMWAWTKAFLELLAGQDAQRKSVDAPGQLEPRVLQAVARAYWANSIVPDVLLGRISIPKKLPETSAYDTEEEALIYGAMAMSYWSATPGALRRLSDAVDRVTAGLPSPFGARTSSGRGRIERLWRAYRFREKIPTRDRHLLKVLLDYPEYGVVWFMAESPKAETLDIDGGNPFLLVGVLEAIERVLDDREVAGVTTGDHGAMGMSGMKEAHDPTNVRTAMGDALRSLMHEGMSRQQAMQFLSGAYAHEWASAQIAASMLDGEAVASHLRYVARLASGQISPDVVLARPARNKPCPCGSGRKSKECCGRQGGWPFPPVIALARCLKSGQGKAQPLARSHVMGQGVYTSAEELDRLAPQDPLVILDNTSVVAEDLLEQGWYLLASLALQDNVSLARTLPDRRHLVTALRDAVATLSCVDGYEEYVSQYACELATMAEDPVMESQLWAVAGQAFMAKGQIIQAEQAINRAMSTGQPHAFAKLARAEYLVTVGGHREAACELYRQVVKDCAAATGPEYEKLAEEAKQRLRKLERLERAATKRS